MRDCSNDPPSEPRDHRCGDTDRRMPLEPTAPETVTPAGRRHAYPDPVDQHARRHTWRRRISTAGGPPVLWSAPAATPRRFEIRPSRRG